MLTVRDLMMPDPITLASGDTLRLAADVLTSAGITGAPVVAGGRVVGVVSLTDILAFEADDPGVPVFRPEILEPFEQDIEPGQGDGIPEPDEPNTSWFARLWEDGQAEVGNRMEEADGPEWDPLDEHTVAEVMNRVVFHVAPLTPVTEAARLMEKEKIHRVLVLDGHVPVGILTTSDIVRAVAHGDMAPAGVGPSLIL